MILRIRLDAEQIEHLLRGGEVQVISGAGKACIVFADIGYASHMEILKRAIGDEDTREGQVLGAVEE